MNVSHVKDVDIVTGWYVYTGTAPDPASIETQLTSPFAFAVVANYRNTYYSPTAEQFVKAGWKPIVWKESSHGTKYSVQLYIKETTAKPTAAGTDYMPSLNCSTFWHAFDKPKDFDAKVFPTAPHSYGQAASKDNLKFIRLARPIAKDALAYFKVDPMWQLCCKTKWNQYWAWGYPGVADNAKCKY